jgi:putative transposase
MKRSRFSETEIIFAVKQVEAGISVKEIARKYGVSEKTVYGWRKKYDGLSPSELKRLKDLERENAQLKKLVADLSLDKEVLQDVLRKSSEACPQARAGWRGQGGSSHQRTARVQASRTGAIDLSLHLTEGG